MLRGFWVKAFEQSLLFPVDKKLNFGIKEDAQVGKISQFSSDSLLFLQHATSSSRPEETKWQKQETSLLNWNSLI
jgi:hypothetical protein